MYVKCIEIEINICYIVYNKEYNVAYNANGSLCKLERVIDIKNPDLKQQAYLAIKNRILNLEIQPNERIVEQELAELLEISRTPVREAINRLASEGFIRVIPRRGCYCIALSLKQIDDIIDVRLSLESLAVRTCIRLGISTQQIEELAQLTREFEDCIQQGDKANVNVLDSKFHRKLAEISGNQLLIDYLNDIESYMTLTRNMELSRRGIDKSRLALEDHKNILRAIIECDSTQAVVYIERNVNNMRINIGGQ